MVPFETNIMDRSNSFTPFCMPLSLSSRRGAFDLFCRESSSCSARFRRHPLQGRSGPRVEQIEFEVFDVSFVGLRSFSGKDRIVFAPASFKQTIAGVGSSIWMDSPQRSCQSAIIPRWRYATPANGEDLFLTKTLSAPATWTNTSQDPYASLVFWTRSVITAMAVV